MHTIENFTLFVDLNWAQFQFSPVGRVSLLTPLYKLGRRCGCLFSISALPFQSFFIACSDHLVFLIKSQNNQSSSNVSFFLPLPCIPISILVAPHYFLHSVPSLCSVGSEDCSLDFHFLIFWNCYPFCCCGQAGLFTGFYLRGPLSNRHSTLCLNLLFLFDTVFETNINLFIYLLI